MTAYAIITGRRKFDLELQIIVYSEAQAKREIKDLKGMGCEDARMKVFAHDSEAYEWIEKNS
jgi:hypothetical protein